MKTNIHFRSYLGQFSLEWKMFQTKVIEKFETHIVYSVTFFRKTRRLWDNMEKYCRAWQATDDNMAHAHVPKATDTPTEYAVVIVFPPQQWMHERASMFTYIAPLVNVWIEKSAWGPGGWMWYNYTGNVKWTCLYHFSLSAFIRGWNCFGIRIFKM